MSTQGSQRQNTRLDVTLLKQWQVNANLRLDALAQAYENVMGEVYNVGNTTAINLEAMRRLLVKKGMFGDEEFREMAQAVGTEVQKAMQEKASMMEAGPPVVEETDDALDAPEDEEDEEEEEAAPQSYPV